jgi:hypothetical protein
MQNWSKFFSYFIFVLGFSAHVNAAEVILRYQNNSVWNSGSKQNQASNGHFRTCVGSTNCVEEGDLFSVYTTSEMDTVITELRAEIAAQKLEITVLNERLLQHDAEDASRSAAILSRFDVLVTELPMSTTFVNLLKSALSQ